MARKWPGTARELAVEQAELAAVATARPIPGPPDLLGGCFVCFERGRSGPGHAGEPGWAAAAAMTEGSLAAGAVVTGTAGAEYAPGLLALREGPLLAEAVEQLPVRPDVLLVNATGRDHPRRFGLASHLGAIADLATVGVTHRPLVATGSWPGPEQGMTSPLRISDELVGYWLRSRAEARPIAVHAAWRTSAIEAVEIVSETSSGFRTPAPIRFARQLAREARTAG